MASTHAPKIVLALLLACRAAGQQAAPKFDLEVDPAPVISGNCKPSRIHFTGRLRASAPGQVIYTWTRSDKAASPTQTLTFEKSGSIAVTYDWLFKGTGKGWAALKILSPAQAESRKAEFQVNCGK